MGKEQNIFKGIWWLPEKANSRMNGILKIENNKIILELEGHIKREKLKFLLNGKTNDKIEITLLDCYIEKDIKTTIKDGSKIFESIIRCDYAFVGIIYKSESDIKFKEISARYSYFTGWTGINRPEVKTNKNSITYNNLELDYNIETELHDGNKIIIENHWFPDIGRPYADKLTIEKYSNVKFKFTNSLSFKDCLEYVFYFRNFISISLREAVGILNIDASYNLNRSDIKIFNIYCYFYSDYDENKYIYYNALFTFKDIKDNFNLYLSNFFEKKGILKYIVDVYSEILQINLRYITEEFLLYTRLLEAYHRNNPKMKSFDLKKEEFKSKRDTVLKLVERYKPDLEDWLCGVINRYGNNKSFTNILNDIINSLKIALVSFAFDKRTVKMFIKKVRDTRNILTHPKDEKNKNNNDYTEYIYPMTRKLEIILLAIILKEIGFEDENIKNIFLHKYELRYFYHEHSWKLEPIIIDNFTS